MIQRWTTLIQRCFNVTFKKGVDTRSYFNVGTLFKCKCWFNAIPLLRYDVELNLNTFYCIINNRIRHQLPTSPKTLVQLYWAHWDYLIMQFPFFFLRRIRWRSGIWTRDCGYRVRWGILRFYNRQPVQSQARRGFHTPGQGRSRGDDRYI